MKAIRVTIYVQNEDINKEAEITKGPKQILKLKIL